MSYNKKIILLKLNEINLSSGLQSNTKVEVRLLSNSATIQTPLEDYARFEIPKNLTSDVTMTITFHYLINKTYLQINKSEIKISQKLLSKDTSKTPSIDFIVDKPIARMIDSNNEDIKVDSKFTLVLTAPSSSRLKAFLEEIEKQKTHIPAKTVNPMHLFGSNNSNLPKKDESKDKDISNFEEEKPEEELTKEEHDKKVRLRSQVVRKSLNINYDEFTYNTACKRCNYMERLIKAQEKDIEVLQNQVECFLRGNLNSALDKAFELESENLLKSEPVFKKIFSDIDVNLEKAEQNKIYSKRVSQSPSPRKSAQVNSSDSFNNTVGGGARNRVSSSDGRSNRLVQKPGEEVNVYMLDNDRYKKIEKYEQEIDNLRGQVLSLTKEKKTLEVIRIENEALRVQIAKAEKLRVDLEQKLIDNATAYQTKIELNMQDIEKILTEKRYFEDRAHNLEITNQNLEFENRSNQNKIKDLEESLKINKVNIDVITNNNGTITTLKDEFAKFEKSRVHQQDEFKKSIGELANRINDLKNENNKIMADNLNYFNKMKEMEHTNQNKTKELIEKHKKIIELEAANITLKSEHLNITEIMRHRDELTSKFNRVMEINYNLNEDLAKVNKSFGEKIKVITEKNDIYEKENNSLREQLDQKRRELIDKSNLIADLRLKIEKLELKNTELNSQKLYAMTSDENNKILQDTIKSIFDFNGKIIVESNNIGDYVIRQADKNMTAQHYIRKLMKALFDKEKQLKEYRKYVDLSKYQEKDTIYNPTRQDQIDMKLGELINNYPNRSRMKENFVRESRGNYRYGDKKINIISEGNRFSIKYLSNLLSFDDFVDIYG